MPSLGLSFSSSKASADTTSTANTGQRAGNRGGGAIVKTTINGSVPGTVPTWLIIAAVAMVFLVVVGLIFAAI